MLNSWHTKTSLNHPLLFFIGTKLRRSRCRARRRVPVSKFDDHKRRAAECLRLAREAADKTNKALLIEMAQTWAKLAEQDKMVEQERTKIGKEQG
jgi:hypothetical protein